LPRPAQDTGERGLRKGIHEAVSMLS
jgi:hypothetical protein